MIKQKLFCSAFYAEQLLQNLCVISKIKPNSSLSNQITSQPQAKFLFTNRFAKLLKQSAKSIRFTKQGIKHFYQVKHFHHTVLHSNKTQSTITQTLSSILLHRNYIQSTQSCSFTERHTFCGNLVVDCPIRLQDSIHPLATSGTCDKKTHKHGQNKYSTRSRGSKINHTNHYLQPPKSIEYGSIEYGSIIYSIPRIRDQSHKPVPTTHQINRNPPPQNISTHAIDPEDNDQSHNQFLQRSTHAPIYLCMNQSNQDLQRVPF